LCRQYRIRGMVGRYETARHRLRGELAVEPNR